MTSSKKIAIVQSNYIPWKGYFDLIAQVDEFILYDCVQYTRRDWRNRNHIKTPQGPRWMSIPVASKGRFKDRISDMQVCDSRWRQKHWQAIHTNYAGARCFQYYADSIHNLYTEYRAIYLSEINRDFLVAICKLLGIHTRISSCDDYQVDRHLDKNENLTALCHAAGGTEYVSGRSAEAYLCPQVFENSGIRVTYTDYSGYTEYNQLFGPFVHEVSIIDLIFNEGDRAIDFMQHAGRPS